VLEKRLLGRTGLEITILGLGGVKYNLLEDDQAAAVINRAIDLGINYIDTAHSYADSERKLGLVIGERRKEVVLATKSTARDRDGFLRQMEESFVRLRTDYIDIVQMHDVKDEADLAERLDEKSGAVRAAEQLRSEGRIGFIGLTGHTSPEPLAAALRAYPFDTLLVSLGAVHEAVRPFYDTIMPAALERGVGVLGMKATAYGFLSAHLEHALRFVMGLPGVASAVVGMDSIEQVERNVAIADAFTPLSDIERSDLLAAAECIYQGRVEEAWFIKKR
jgi:uncharacterized protein